VIASVGLGAAQAPSAKPTSNLELRLHAKAMQHGVPQAFTFLLVNRSDHNVRVPMPSVGCENAFAGALQLRLHFVPLKPVAPSGLGHGCACDTGNWPPILERVAAWQVLHAGESLSLGAGKSQLYYETDLSGSYEFWVEYAPPVITADDQQTLQQAGIDVPHGPLTSPYLKFERKP
jgi:hypothetical protein